MATNNIKFETLEDVANYVLENTYRAEMRWSLEDRNQKVYIDPVAGEKWEAECPEYVSMDNPRRAEYDKAEVEHNAHRPEMKNVIIWSLRKSDGSYHSTWISLSTELGEMFCKVWKTAPAYRGTSYAKRVGLMTLPGLLKRLGNTEISKQVADARKNVELERQKNQRNYARREVVQAAKDLLAKMEKYSKQHPEIVWPENFGLDKLALMDEAQEQ